ncbi:enoyl-CoA hydratase-related protein [Magnetospirillum sp. SS-4]|uniref:enoyl-CoA hydratase-related protein n=1 Tax=Magnetospirillum sp. SS-4 TaxID=2681465 RepID=UPI0013802538|nr:enoyl-CoA hydratase-related protein [Magnetospirillum sp. SS-4]CAA7619418.1 Enoyl-CoA hydratase/carnithine racemase [Magnetospirillum sp. SS-4]
MTETLHVRISGALATVTLNRPEVHNAIDSQLAGNLTLAFQKMGVAEAVRAIVIEARGQSFCAGIDLDWVRRTTDQDAADNHRDAMQLAMMLDAIDRCPKPVIAVVHGAALGLGAGLAAAADMAIAAEEASFALSEVRLGLAPSIAAPYVAAAIGGRFCRRYMVTGERFDAREALRLGLVHGVVAADKLAAARDHVTEACLKGGPKAQAAVKDLIRVIDDSPMGPDLMRYTATHFSDLRVSEEGREGLAAFLEKRPSNWTA